MKTSLTERSVAFARAQDGTMVVFGLFLTVALLIVGGLAADYANAVRIRTYMQAAADSAAHAALIEREYGTLEEARAAGVAMAKATMPTNLYGDAIRSSDINFGTWDSDTDSFNIDNASRDAVVVDTARLAARSNPLATHFLKLVGFDAWELRQQSVFETYIPSCLTEGMNANVGIELQGHNNFHAPFCLFSNDWMTFASDNTFQSGTRVELPDLSKLSSGDSTGLTEAMHKSDPRNLRILERINEIYDGVQDPSSRHYRSYITTSAPVILDHKDEVNVSTWKEGRIHKATCLSKNGSIKFGSGVTLKKGVLVTNCVVKANGASLEDVVIATLNENPDSVNSPSGLTIGKKDNCAPGGDAQIVTMGGVSVSTNMSMHNGQIIAAGDVKFTSHADGNWGASIIAGGKIDGNSHGIWRSCGTGMENNFTAEYFRLAY